MYNISSILLGLSAHDFHIPTVRSMSSKSAPCLPIALEINPESN